MIFSQMWERYFLKEILKIFTLFLSCFYGLYILIDYASHTSALANHHTQIQLSELGRYYLFVFASRADILIPLALLLATIKNLCTLNTRQELVALMAGGFSLKMLLRPFLITACFCTLLLFLNEQYLLPPALKKLRRIEDANKHQRKRNNLPLSVRSITLEDGSLLLFQSYDSVKEQFFDVYWLRSFNDVYRIKFLSPYKTPPEGKYVDHLVRQKDGTLLQVESFVIHPFLAMRFNSEILQSTIQDADALSLTELWQQLPNTENPLSEKESRVLTAFYWKSTIPWLCLLAVLAPAPFCVYFSRQLPIFFIYICGIFGLIAFYMFMDAASVVAKRQVLHPLWAITFPFLGLFILAGWRFIKMK